MQLHKRTINNLPLIEILQILLWTCMSVWYSLHSYPHWGISMYVLSIGSKLLSGVKLTLLASPSAWHWSILHVTTPTCNQTALIKNLQAFYE